MWKLRRLHYNPLIFATGAVATAQQSSSAIKQPLPFNAMPGPKPIPVMGNALQLKQNVHRLRTYYEECFKKYGDIFRVKALGKN